jgi:hypothetical protein
MMPMTDFDSLFLAGVDGAAVCAALNRAGGNEIRSGKLASPESSAALAVNCFGAYLATPRLLPPFPALADLDWPAATVAVERQMRFPWRGGRHPWLDAAVETPRHLIGIESKRFEPFRDTKCVSLSEAYDRPLWGEGMQSWCRMRDDLRSGARQFRFLDAGQLVKHALGLITEARRHKKEPVLLYLFAEPASRGRAPISTDDLEAHRREITDFADAVSGSAVRFAANSYGEWLASWPLANAAHRRAIMERFRP